MVRLRRFLVGVILLVLAAAFPSVSSAADEAVCYAAADGPNRLVSSWRTGGGFVDIGAFGVGAIEAIAFNTADGLLYGEDGADLGTIDMTTGVFTLIGAAGDADGIRNGAPETVTLDSLDGLAFDPGTGYLYGAERVGGDDLLVRIDPTTGAVVQDAFGPGIDYVEILASPITGFDDIDDITVDPTDGQMYGISNDGGNGDHLIKIDKTDGSVIDVGAFLGTDDMEGLSVSPDGNLFGTTGNGGDNSLWDIDKLTGFATFVFAYPDGITDMEGVACMRSNVITGTVFVDSNDNGSLDPGELGLAGVTVRFYSDNNGDGLVDGGDTLIQTTISPSSGFYEFFISSFGDYVIDIDTATLPLDWALTTDNIETANFPDYGSVDSGNNFGAIGPAGDIRVTKTADLATACPGDVVTYTMIVRNNSTITTHTGITVSDALPLGATYVAESTTATGVAPVITFRVTEYFVDVGVFGDAGYDLTLDQDLVSNYFVIVQGSAGTGGTGDDRGPDDNYARLTDDPFGNGDLGTSSGSDVLRFERDSGTDSWVGVITVVECLSDCTAGGFTLLSVEDVTAPSGDSSGTDTSATAWSDINQVMLMGGFNGAGCFSADGNEDNTPVCHKRIWPTGTNTINWSRNSATGDNSAATSTVMVVEWGSEWTVQRVNVAATNANAGDGADSASHYTTGAIASVARANTWVWGTGWTDNNGPGDSAEGVLITLGDGANQNANETTVAVGLEHTGNDIDFEVYTLTHPDIAVDYRFKTDGDNLALGVNIAVDSADSERMALSYNGNSDTGDNHPRSMFSARYLTDSSVRLERRRTDSEFPAWVQGIDYSGIGTGATSVTKDNVPGGANPDLADGVPPNLVTAADGFQIAPSGTMTVTFQATIDNPYNGAATLVNAATATSAEGGFDVNSVSFSVTLATIGNLVWHDFNPNDIQDADEPGIADVPIRIYGPGPDDILGTADDVWMGATFTDANGNYSVSNLGPGDYRVEVNEAWLTANGFPVRRYPAANPYWDLGADPPPSLPCGGTESGADFGYWDGTTVPVTLSSFRASPGRGGTLVEWSTATELGTVGFNLYALTEAGWQRVNSQLIPSHAVDSVEIQRYEFEVSGADAELYLIEDVDILGLRRQHGPFAVGVTHGLDPVASPEKSIDWPSIDAEHRAKVTARRAVLGNASVKGTRTGGGRRAAYGKIVNLLVDTNAIYRLSYEDLLAYGIDLAGVDGGRIALVSGGEAVPILVRGGPVFGPGSSIEWVGHGLDTLYTTTNVYTLTLEPRSAVRVVVDRQSPDPAAAPPDHYAETLNAERNRSYSFAAPNGDPWYDTAILAFTEPKSAAFEITVDDLVRDVDDAMLRVELWGTTNWPANPDHHLEVSFNGIPLADKFFDGLIYYPLEIELPAGVLEEGVNTLELTLPGDTGVDWDMVTFDSFSVTYPRGFTARDGRLSFAADAEVLRVDGLPSSRVLVYRLVGDTVTLVAGKEIAQGANGYSVTFRGAPGPARYLVSTADALGVPGIGPVHDGTSILKGRADYLVISHPDFLDGLDPLVEAREGDARRVKVVDVDDVYAEFSHGVLDPNAIRAYIAFAAEKLGVEMVLLVGGDSYDYHDYLGLGAISFIPSLYAKTGEIVSFAPVDPLFTDIDGDGLPDLPIGRLPVRTNAELDFVIAKTLDYAAKSYSETAVFAADKAEETGTTFAEISDSFIAQLPPGWEVKTAYLDKWSVANARKRLFGAINGGSALTSFFGHSGPTVWSFDNLFHASDVEDLTNFRMPTVVTQWGCWNNYYVAPKHNTLGHMLLLFGDQGAAAAFGASTVTLTDSDQALGALFMPRLTQPGMTIGDALQEAKQILAVENPELVDVLLGWTLLGDPALVVEPE